jgi:PncC family amidohydrolase
VSGRPAPAADAAGNAPGPRDGLAAGLVSRLAALGLKLVCAESCTGGLVSGALTSVPGASEVLWGSLVAYSNECKISLLRVPRETIESCGAVSAETAQAMAEGALVLSGADLALAVTGVAGPGGGSPDKPVGLVCFAWAGAGGARASASRLFSGDRGEVRAQAVEEALRGAMQLAVAAGEGHIHTIY